MMNSVGLRELRQQTSAIIKRVRGGESIDVTEHGHRVARLVPIRPDRLDQLVTDGRAERASADLLDLVEALGLPAADGDQLPSAALAELRADER